MSTQTTISQLKELGLHGMAEAFEAMMVLPSQKRPGLDCVFRPIPVHQFR